MFAGLSPESLGAAVVLFVATNVDDLLLLALFFADRRFARGAVIGGQVAGLALLVGASAAAALAALAVPPGWPALLGVVPLAMGLHALWRLWRARGATDDDDDEEAEEVAAAARRGRRPLAQAAAVAAVTIANGGDNLGAWVPWFAGDVAALPWICALFLMLTLAWCALALALVRHPLAAAATRRFGHLALPVVLVLLGLALLWDARVLWA